MLVDVAGALLLGDSDGSGRGYRFRRGGEHVQGDLR